MRRVDRPSNASVVELLARRGVIDPAFVTRIGEATEPSLLCEMVAAGVLDRVAARAIVLAIDGRLDERDLRQLFDPIAARGLRAGLPAAADDGPRHDPGLSVGGSFGRYPIRGVLGSGRSGTVYLSAHPVTAVPVALKVSPAGETVGTDRVLAEARTLARIDHPNVVRMYDADRIDGRSGVVLEYADGEPVACALARGPLRPAVAFRAARHAIRGLRAAFRAGFVHGDVKPANLLPTAAGRFKLADFGSARAAHAPLAGPTLVEATWRYAAPERFDGRGDHRADIYSLGLTLHHLLTGVSPVSDDGFAECRAAHHELAPEPLHWSVPGVGRRASDLIRRMTAADPDARPAGYDELWAEAEHAFRVETRSEPSL